MATEKIREVLAELRKELERVEDVDTDVHQTLQELHRHVEALDQSAAESMLDQVKELESKFAANHPVLERIARELVDAIAKMGI